MRLSRDRAPVAVDNLGLAVNHHVRLGMESCGLPRAFLDVVLRAFKDGYHPRSLALQQFQKP